MTPKQAVEKILELLKLAGHCPPDTEKAMRWEFLSIIQQCVDDGVNARLEEVAAELERLAGGTVAAGLRISAPIVREMKVTHG